MPKFYCRLIICSLIICSLVSRPSTWTLCCLSCYFTPQLASSPQAVEFLYHKGFPTALGHVQSGNIFVVDNVCKLGGYENTLLGYKTRVYRICKDHMDHFDTILFGELNCIILK